MSTVLPSDTPPPVPPTTPYPSGIASFYYPNDTVVHGEPYNAAVPLQFNANEPMKNWSRTADPSENLASYKLSNCISVQGVEVPDGIALTIAGYQATNVAPPDLPPAILESLSGSAYFTQPAILRRTRPLLSTEAITPGLPGEFIVTNSADPSATPPAPPTPGEQTMEQNVAECVKILRAAYPGLV